MAAVLLVTLPGLALGHSLGAVRATLEERPGGSYVLEVEAGPAVTPFLAVPELPAACAHEGAPGGAGSEAAVVRYEFTCAAPGLTAGDTLRLPWQRQGVMLAAHWLDGSTARQFFARSGAAIEVPLAQLQAGSGSLGDAARRYVLLGIEHILGGFDHLLFVFGLLLLVRGPWMLLKTVTAFTLAHSITLALATLGIVHVPARPVEAAIALSIVFLGTEIVHARQGRPGLAARQPWLVAFVFGLLHGFGFAGALAQLGLPVREIPIGLLFFNVGVEIGQLMFVAAILALGWGLRRLHVRWPVWAEMVPTYTLGTIAAFWFIERTSAILFAT